MGLWIARRFCCWSCRLFTNRVISSTIYLNFNIPFGMKEYLWSPYLYIRHKVNTIKNNCIHHPSKNLNIILIFSSFGLPHSPHIIPKSCIRGSQYFEFSILVSLKKHMFYSYTSNRFSGLACFAYHIKYIIVDNHSTVDVFVLSKGNTASSLLLSVCFLCH